jgi:hypothetical protein
MAIGAGLCDLCRSEDFRPRRLKAADHTEEWDGIRYPSLRRNQPTGIPRERYEEFLRIVLGPVLRAEHFTAGEAA